MQVSSGTLRLALSRILRDREARPAQPIPMAALEQAWAFTGLRQADLRDALRAMMEEDILRAVEKDGALAFALTPDGYGQLYHAELTLPAMLERATDEWTLVQARNRRWVPSRPGWHQRRQPETGGGAPKKHA